MVPVIGDEILTVGCDSVLFLEVKFCSATRVRFKFKTGDIHCSFGGMPDSLRLFNFRVRLIKLILCHVSAGVQIRNPFQSLLKVIRIRCRSTLFFLCGFQRSLCRRHDGFRFRAASRIQGL